MKILGIVLIVAGIVALIYGGFTYSTTKKDVDMGPLQISHKQNHSRSPAASPGGDRDRRRRRSALFRREKGLTPQVLFL